MKSSSNWFEKVCRVLLLALLSTPAFAEPADEVNALTAAAVENRLRLVFDGTVFSGPALDRLLSEARTAQFFAIGEEHGIAENPKFAAQLFTMLTKDGYEKFAIEISPPMAAILDEAATDGLAGIRELFAMPGGEPAFFGMQEEAEMIATLRAALPDSEEVFWGVDYEVAGDQALLRALLALQPPESAREPLDELVAASSLSWSKYYETGRPQHIFTFSGDPAQVENVIVAWPEASAEAAAILNALHETLSINQLWVEGKGWESNARRAALFRSSFLQHWQEAREKGESPKVMIKLGGNHVVRGRNVTGTYDLGTLLPEIAAMEGSRSVSMLVLPGPESMTAVLDPTDWSYRSKPAKDDYAKGLEALTDAAYDDAFTLIDLAMLRPVVGNGTKKYGADAARTVHGFDYLLVMTGSTASGELEHD